VDDGILTQNDHNGAEKTANDIVLPNSESKIHGGGAPNSQKIVLPDKQSKLQDD